MKAYIQGIGNISPQKTFDNNSFLNDIVEYQSPVLRCVEPEYEKYIDPRQLRRMSRIIKNSWSAAKICLDDSGIEIPDAIITGSGLGCVEDTEKFLFSIYENEEKLLPPTPFIQSTHNTIGSQIAFMLQSTKYNVTHTQRGGSFEYALIDGLLLLEDTAYNNALVGGFDEITDKQLILYNRLNYYRTGLTSNLKLLRENTQGTIAGEGNTFFLITREKPQNCYGSIEDMSLFSNPENSEVVFQNIEAFIQNNQLDFSDIDLVVTGINGDQGFDKVYFEAINRYLQDKPVAYFKHLCGEYHTASAFGLWMAANILKDKNIPEIVKLNSYPNFRPKKILFYNHYRNINHSLILLSQC